MKSTRTAKAPARSSPRRGPADVPRAPARCRIALIRGINVGRAKRVAMADLRRELEGLGYTDVRTLLNSGNVVFCSRGTASRAAAGIEEALASRLQVPARVLVLESVELVEIVKNNPLARIAKDPTRLFVSVPMNAADLTRLAPLARQDWGEESLALGARVAYAWCPAGQIESRLSESIGRVLGDAVTTRNWATVMKLRAMVER